MGSRTALHPGGGGAVAGQHVVDAGQRELPALAQHPPGHHGLPGAAGAARRRRVAAVCGGAFLLGAVGLLDGRAATTHWICLDDLARCFPAAHVQRGPIFTQDGPVHTSAGVTAGIDLALALVEADLGPRVAREVAQFLVVFLQRPGGQEQFSARMCTEPLARSSLRDLLDSVVERPAADHSLAALSRRAGFSERHLARLFAREVGMSPSRYVDRVRVEASAVCSSG